MKRDPIQIRKARLPDLPLLLAMEREFQRDERANVLQQNPRLKQYLRRGPQRDGFVRKTLQSWIRSRSALVFILEDGSAPVGFAATFIEKLKHPFLLPDRFGFIAYMFVKRRYRGRGLSSLLMREALAWLAKHKITHIALTVLADNEPARSIWKKHGFSDFAVFAWKLN